MPPDGQRSPHQRVWRMRRWETGFRAFMAGNTTFISGVDDEKVDDVISLISKYSSRRTQIVPSTSTMDVGMYSSFPVEVTVGGSTIFVLNVDRFEKV